jgi:hypothetical protein
MTQREFQVDLAREGAGLQDVAGPPPAHPAILAHAPRLDSQARSGIEAADRN